MQRPLTYALLGATAILFAGSVTAVAAPEDRQARFERMMTELDADQSGAVSFEEFARRGDDRFMQTDSDGDGFLTPQEREAAKAQAMEGREGKRAKRAGKRGDKRLARVDTDQDGNISREEHQAAQQAHFARLDADGSGAVTQAEFRAQMEARRGKMRERRGN